MCLCVCVSVRVCGSLKRKTRELHVKNGFLQPVSKSQKKKGSKQTVEKESAREPPQFSQLNSDPFSLSRAEPLAPTRALVLSPLSFLPVAGVRARSASVWVCANGWHKGECGNTKTATKWRLAFHVSYAFRTFILFFSQKKMWKMSN